MQEPKSQIDDCKVNSATENLYALSSDDDSDRLTVSQEKKVDIGDESKDLIESADASDFQRISSRQRDSSGCCAINCKTCLFNSGTKYFALPTHPERRNLWIEKIGRRDLHAHIDYYLCILHFTDSCFHSPDEGTSCLKDDAIPTLFQDESVSEGAHRTSPSSVQRRSSRSHKPSQKLRDSIKSDPDARWPGHNEAKLKKNSGTSETLKNNRRIAAKGSSYPVSRKSFDLSSCDAANSSGENLELAEEEEEDQVPFGHNSSEKESLKKHKDLVKMSIDNSEMEIPVQDGDFHLRIEVPKPTVAQLELKYSCNYCDSVFSSAFFLCHHEEAHRLGPNCVVCEMCFETAEALESHILRDHYCIAPAKHDMVTGILSEGATNEGYVCQDCGKIWRDLPNLINHRKQKHHKKKLQDMKKAPIYPVRSIGFERNKDQQLRISKSIAARLQKQDRAISEEAGSSGNAWDQTSDYVESEERILLMRMLRDRTVELIQDLSTAVKRNHEGVLLHIKPNRILSKPLTSSSKRKISSSLEALPATKILKANVQSPEIKEGTTDVKDKEGHATIQLSSSLNVDVAEADMMPVSVTPASTSAWDGRKIKEENQELSDDEMQTFVKIETADEKVFKKPKVVKKIRRGEIFHQNLHRKRQAPILCNVQCLLCDGRFTELAKLRVHRRSAHSEYKKLDQPWFQCIDCATDFNSDYAFNSHRSSVLRYKVMCAFCDLELNTTCLTVCHMNEEHREQQLLCNVCLDEKGLFPNSYQLILHKRKSHKKQQRCHLCNKILSSIPTLREHMNIHKGTKPHQCPKCGQMFAGVSRYIMHRQRKHEGGVRHNIACPFCDRMWHSRRDMANHVRRSHRGCNDRVCMICGKEFDNLKELEDHSLEVHREVHSKEMKRKHHDRRKNDNIIEENCPYCDRIVRGNIGKFLHISRKHPEHAHELYNEERLGKCEICGKLIANKTTLKIHMQTHNQDRPYQCPTCNRRFLRKETLRKHEITHTGFKRFSCEYCHKLYTNNFNCRIHQRKCSRKDDPLPPPTPEQLESMQQQGMEVAQKSLRLQLVHDGTIKTSPQHSVIVEAEHHGPDPEFFNAVIANQEQSTTEQSAAEIIIESELQQPVDEVATYIQNEDAQETYQIIADDGSQTVSLIIDDENQSLEKFQMIQGEDGEMYALIDGNNPVYAFVTDDVDTKVNAQLEETQQLEESEAQY